ncbi:DNA primase [Breznakia sp. PF5-3]|uniref:DNA primase n=1 Tax=unclassified Breznakia TaxID=2623764 RepID=UPI002406D515|nr:MULTISPECIES: DNA primase [unclassified Breznakia]MDF9824432.1 DNA primase [Breznakia sp. PM6-1]MDF9835161.1 DNA primase [Breznakia sp. PF5-3]MDF9838314.1 DNA primase [Breznakia sp. PFB2-8]MDF9860330.1 DNA primase [Breznakia sp. PH5-24]
MARIPENVINDIRNRVDIVDIISQYIPLTKKGKNFVGVCPFHDDHNPSMSVSSDKQIFHCFVCGAGGNAFTFTQKYENISFIEAVKRVADLGNIPVDIDISKVQQPINQKYQPLYNVLQDTIEFCSYELRSVDGKAFYEYIAKRGIHDDIIKKFAIGYNPSGNKLYDFLKAKKHKDEDIVETNVVRISPQGMQDVFYNRLMIPIHDNYGNPVGFTARVIDGSSDAKYINTAETLLYHKGNLLFNYHRAKDEAKRSGNVLVVEGAMDVLAFEKVDIANCVATLGTAATMEQIKLLKSLNAKVLLFYDGDNAGQEATYKFCKLALSKGLHIEIIKNDHGLDPDEIIEKFGKNELIEVSKKTISWIEFLFEFLRKKYNLDNYTEKKEYAKIIGDEISRLDDQFEKDNYYQRLAQISGFDLSNEQNVHPMKKERLIKSEAKLVKPKAGIKNAQIQILSLMLISKQANELFRHELGFLPEPDYNNLAINIINFYRNHDTIIIADLLNYINEEDVKKVLLEITNWELAPSEFHEEVMREAISKIKNGLISEKINTLLEQSNQMSDPIQKARIADEVIKLRRQRGD